MEEGGEKRRKLDELERFRRRIPYTSASALSAVLQEVKRSGVPELDTRKEIREARDAAVGTESEYGPVYAAVDMEPSVGHEASRPKLNFIAPFALLSHLLRVCVSFGRFIEHLFEVKTPTAADPWRVLLYSDEVTPGNQLLPSNDRKIQAVYWSFLEFAERLSDESVWFTWTAKRSSQLHKVSGGMSQIFGKLLHMLFIQEPFELGGVAFTLPSGRRIRIHAKLGFFIQDGGAHKLVWHTKGDSGMKFCLLCRNLFAMETVMGHADADGTIICSATKVSDLDIATSAELKEAVRRIHACKPTSDVREQAIRE